MHRKIDFGLGSSMRVALSLLLMTCTLQCLNKPSTHQPGVQRAAPCLPLMHLPCPSDRSSPHPQTFPTVVQGKNVVVHAYSARSCMAVQPRHLAVHETHTLCLVSELVVRHLEEARLTALLVLPDLRGSRS